MGNFNFLRKIQSIQVLAFQKEQVRIKIVYNSVQQQLRSYNASMAISLQARIPTDDLIPKTRCGRNQHSLAFQIPSASKDGYQYSFFPMTIRDWNDLPESLISSSELSDDSVSKFTSLVS